MQTFDFFEINPKTGFVGDKIGKSEEMTLNFGLKFSWDYTLDTLALGSGSVL